jgi:16S rRNA (cytosine967-C5)-methyltransferase
VSPARATAFDVLLRVMRGGYASDLLIEATAALDSRDAGLASQLVFGCLRFQGQLDYLIDYYAGRPAKTAPDVRIVLWMGIYQLRYLDRIPRHAAVSESVEIAKRGGNRFSAGFVNAILRKVNRDPVQWPNAAVELSCPKWLLEKWTRQYGSNRAEAIAAAALKQPEVYVRSSHPAPNLESAGLPGAYRVTSGSAPPGARIQDIGSQSIVPLLDLAPGQSMLDLCAAPGNKTAQALESEVQAIACDLHLSRLRNLPANCVRVVLDASTPLPFSAKFDRILVDAPCSGTGTLARNPEIKWRLDSANLMTLHNLQVLILRNALPLLGPARRLVYSTCSLEREENQDVIAELLATDSGVKLVQEMQRLPGRDPGDGFYAAVLTSDKLANG